MSLTKSYAYYIENDKIAIIETNSAQNKEIIIETVSVKEDDKSIIPSVEAVKVEDKKSEEAIVNISSPSGKFYSPLVRNIAKKEMVSMDELESIVGSGKDSRVTKNDILSYLSGRTAPVKTVTEKPIICASSSNCAPTFGTFTRYEYLISILSFNKS